MSDTHAKLRCELAPLSNGDFGAVFFSTLGIVALTILLECISHRRIDCCTTISDDINAHDEFTNTASSLSPSVVEQQPLPQATPGMEDSQNRANEQDLETAKPKEPQPPQWLISNVSPNIRANRLMAGIFVYAVILTLFVMRMRDISVPHLRSECQPYTSLHLAKSKMPEPNWWVVTLLNILPFICASFGLLRTFADCILVRWGTGLGYGSGKKDKSWTWLPCMPMFIAGVVLFLAIQVLLTFPIAWIMGRPLSGIWEDTVPETDAGGASHLEMEGEEMRRLVDDVDGESEDDEGRVEGPPAYDEAVQQQESGVKGGAAVT